MPFLDNGNTQAHHKCSPPTVTSQRIGDHDGPTVYTGTLARPKPVGVGAKWQCDACQVVYTLRAHDRLQGYWEWAKEGIKEPQLAVGDPGPPTFTQRKRRWYHRGA